MKIDPSAYSKLSAGLKLTHAQLDALTDDEWAQLIEKFPWVESCIMVDNNPWYSPAGFNRGKSLDAHFKGAHIFPTVSDGETPSELLVAPTEREETFHDHYQPRTVYPVNTEQATTVIADFPIPLAVEDVKKVEQKTKRPYNKSKKV